MWADMRLLDLLGIAHPIIQAPMAGASTPEMAIAASEAGGLGSLGCAMMSSEALQVLGDKITSGTNRPVNFNFFCHQPPSKDNVVNQAIVEHLATFYRELGLGEVPEPVATNFPFDAKKCSVLRQFSPKLVSFHFGLPAPELVAQLKSDGVVILSSATTVAEAVWLEQNGADAIIAQGWEAGGHRGYFLDAEDTAVGLFALLPAIVDAVSVPVIAAGGIADGRGIAAALALGASGVQIGTAFLNSPESCTPDVHKAKLLSSNGSDTRTTSVFSGRPARGINNRYMAELAKSEDDLPDFPIMNTLTGPLRKASAAKNSPDFVSLWSGQSVGLNRTDTVANLVERFVVETQAILKRA